VSATIRPFRDEDLAAVLEIAVAAWTPIYASFLQMLGADIFGTVHPEWQAEKKSQVESACRGDHGANVCVAELDGKVVGFISWYLRPQTGIGEIGNNAVHPDYQSAGLDTMMYEHVLARMRESGMKCARVTTGGDPSHAPARRAYEKAGFSRAVPVVNYYREL